MIDFAIVLTLFWVMLYFYTREMYKEVIIPESWSERRRNFFAEIAGVFCIITAPIGFLYVTEEFIYLTLKLVWENTVLAIDTYREAKKLKSGR